MESKKDFNKENCREHFKEDENAPVVEEKKAFTGSKKPSMILKSQKGKQQPQKKKKKKKKAGATRSYNDEINEENR